MMATTTNTQVIIIYKNNSKNLEALKSKFPQLATIQTEQEGIINFLDEKNRPVIIINVHSEDRIEAGIKILASSKKLDPTKVFIPIN